MMERKSEEFQTVNRTALGYLTRREHSRHELSRKLLTRTSCSETVIDRVLDQLQTDGYLSDERFVDMFIRSRKERGKGPIRITAELRQFGIAEELFERTLFTHDSQWSLIARQVRERHFGKALPESASERAKQMRFLQHRGFTPGQIKLAVNGAECDGF